MPMPRIQVVLAGAYCAHGQIQHIIYLVKYHYSIHPSHCVLLFFMHAIHFSE
jgi:hypothetical protein